MGKNEIRAMMWLLFASSGFLAEGLYLNVSHWYGFIWVITLRGIIGWIRAA